MQGQGEGYRAMIERARLDNRERIESVRMGNIGIKGEELCTVRSHV